MSTAAFHPAVARWFDAAFPGPTEAQAAAWPAIMAGRSTLVAAPTGSGKTLTAFLAAIDALVREALEQGGLADETRVVYVSPLKALSNDIALTWKHRWPASAWRCANWACPRWGSALPCAPATPRSRSVRGCGAGRRISW